ncbi:MAG TPA: class II fructose-bisphosphate aldolase [Streptosporangiaceae bacterium]|nr:class II fructose-bisphosphate aldolase [Streptosporangiaceae bacterium]
MPVVSAAEIIGAARAAGCGAGAFNVIGIEHAEAVVAGAEKAGAAVVLQISENCVAYHGALAPIGRAVLAVARAATVPAAVHLDHATNADLVEEAVALGFGSIMYDGSALPFSENVRETARIAARCHGHGVFVEAELGEVGGKDGVHAASARTNPAEAAEFVCVTGVDALAVAVGSSHAMVTRDAVLDLELVRQIHAALPVPLVLHGSSGIPDDALGAAIEAGLTKINIATQLNKVFTLAVRDYLAREGAVTDPRRYLAAGREAVAAEVARLLGVLRADLRSRV